MYTLYWYMVGGNQGVLGQEPEEPQGPRVLDMGPHGAKI